MKRCIIFICILAILFSCGCEKCSVTKEELSEESVVYNLGHTDLNTAEPMAGEVKYAHRIEELVSEPINENALFEIIIYVHIQTDNLTGDQELERLKALGYSFKSTSVWKNQKGVTLRGTLTGSEIDKFPFSDNAGYEITWDSSLPVKIPNGFE